MTNVVVFGKPRDFQSYEYFFGGQNGMPAVNTHREPLLKPTEYENPVLHYFVEDDFVGLELYVRAKGFESDRDGIVFGVAIKSTTDLKIAYAVSNILIPFWEDFATALLDNVNRFKSSTIIDALKSTKWSEDEINTVQGVELQAVRQPKKNHCCWSFPTLMRYNRSKMTLKITGMCI